LWPCFWLLPQAQSVPGEIDIMETIGDQATKLYLSTHGSDASQEFRGIYTGADLTTGFHHLRHRLDRHDDDVVPRRQRGREPGDAVADEAADVHARRPRGRRCR